MANPMFEVLSQGDEIVTGQVVDTNAAWLSQQAIELGFDVTWHTAVGDRLDDLVQVLKDISVRADCCICTGGLGPTSDDLTAEAVAQAFNLPLVFDQKAFEQISSYFIHRNRAMPACNRKQAMLPEGAGRLNNAIGTAPGFALRCGRCWFMFLPGVPSEMRLMFAGEVRPLLEQGFTLTPSELITINTIGIGESDIQERLNDVDIPSDIKLGFRATSGEVQVKLLFPQGYPKAEKEKLTTALADKIGEFVFAVGELNKSPTDIIAVIDRLISTQNKTLTVVETLSCSLVATKMQGFNWLRTAIFQQSPANLALTYGISFESSQLVGAAEAISRAIQMQTDTNMVLIQLVATDVNLALSGEQAAQSCTGLLVENEFYYVERHLSGNATRKKNQAAITMLDILRKYLQQNLDSWLNRHRFKTL